MIGPRVDRFYEENECGELETQYPCRQIAVVAKVDDLA